MIPKSQLYNYLPESYHPDTPGQSCRPLVCRYPYHHLPTNQRQNNRTESTNDSLHKKGQTPY